jgi:NAD(P) transhydrogenase subunit alpha
MEELISPGIYNLIIFVLAIYVGYHVVWNVTPALHTPLMAVTNAISAIVIVGAMLAAALTVTPLGKTMGTLAVALAAVNVFGGFLVTRRMLEMFKKKAPKEKKRRRSNEHESRHDALPDRVDLLYPGPQRPVAPDHLATRQPVRHARHGVGHPDHRRPHL